MKKTFYNSSKQANELDPKSAQYLAQVHATVRNLFTHLSFEGYMFPAEEVESFERWHEETEVRMGMKPRTKVGIAVLQSTERYGMLTIPEYMKGMSFQVNNLSRYVNKRNKHESK
jgi:hypothetical protein